MEKHMIRLDSKNTTYIIRVTETGHLENLYYGRKLKSNAYVEALVQPREVGLGTGTAYSEDNPLMFLENTCLETSTPGKGDYRSPAVVVEYGKGLQTLDFVYKTHRIFKGKPSRLKNFAESYAGENEATTLEIQLEDKVLPIALQLNYTVFQNYDTIARSCTLTNKTSSSVRIQNIASLQLDFSDTDWNVVTFDGAWARERIISRQHLRAGKFEISSTTGVSSASHNPCVFLERPNCSLNHGDCYAFNLIYSGNHREIIEASPYGYTRFQTGINPETFSWKLYSGQSFTTPEAVMTFSNFGSNGASANFHSFINNHIVRGKWKFRERPVLCNNWEATYFNFTESKLLDLAKAAKDLGVELFVLDDGWFGTRDDDTSSLGDWNVNARKLSGGLTKLSEKIHRLGLMFGIWVEPEMISKRSLLFEKHPDWRIAIPDREPSVGRNQYILDYTRKEVRDYIVASMTEVFRLGSVDYVKWDMNRTFSDFYSASLSDMGEFSHRYICGLYEVFDRLVSAFPNILFEGCASGGNRFDLGILCYMPQIWTSDDTDVYCRTYIQNGTSYGYPLSTMGAHVSASPNHQTLRKSDIESRFNVAAFGVFGYEMDLTALSPQQKAIVKAQIEFYKKHRSLLQFGRFFRLEEGNKTRWVVANSDLSEMIVLDFQTLNQPNPGQEVLRIPFARPDFDYEISARQQKINLEVFGSLINMIAPVNLSSDGKVKKILDENYMLKSEEEHHIVSGDVLAYGGIKLAPQFGGTGYNGKVRVLGDFGSRLYCITRIEKEK